MKYIETQQEQQARTVVEKYMGGSSVLIFDADLMHYFKDANIALYICYLKQEQLRAEDHVEYGCIDKYGYWDFSLERIRNSIGFSIEQQEDILLLLQDLNLIDMVKNTIRVFVSNISNLIEDIN